MFANGLWSVCFNRCAMENPPVIVAVAPNGASRTQADHPALPMTAAELAHAAAACADAGATMIHLHARDRDGRHTLAPDAMRDAITAVRRSVGDRMVIQMTSEAAGLYAPEEQMAAVRAVRPEAVSLAIRELCPRASDEPAFAAFHGWLARERIAVQHILYTPLDVSRLLDLVARGIVSPDQPPDTLIVLGRYGQQSGTPADLVPFLAAEPGFGRFMACAFGPAELRCVATAALLGGDVRVGFENNLHLPDGRIAPDNAALVSATVEAFHGLGLTTATADEVRQSTAQFR